MIWNREMETAPRATLRALQGGRRARPPDTDRLRLRSLHGRARLSRRRRAHGADRGAGVVGEYLAADSPPPGFSASGPGLHTVLCPAHRRVDARAGTRSAERGPPLRPVRRRALDGCHAAPTGSAVGHRGRGLLRAERDHRSGSGGGMRGGAAGPPHRRGSFPPRGGRSRVGRAAARGRGGRAGVELSHQAGAAHDPLPHGRRDLARSRALRVWPHVGPDGANQGTERRYAGDQGRQRLPVTAGGGALDGVRSRPALSAHGGQDPGLPDHLGARRPHPPARERMGRLRLAPARSGRPRPAGGRALAGAPEPQPRSRHRPAQDHPPQRGEGGTGRGKESTMSQRVTEAELLARIERGERVESAEEMTEAYRDNLIHLMTMQADSELAGGYGYVPWIMKAPGVDEKHVVAQIVKDEHRHASVMYGLLADLGVDVEAHVRAHDEAFAMRIDASADIGTARITADKRVNIFYYPIDTWADFIFFNFCMDRGAGHQLEDVRQCSYGPWARAIEGIFKEEKFHIRHSEFWVRKLAEDPATWEGAKATRDKWY